MSWAVHVCEIGQTPTSMGKSLCRLKVYWWDTFEVLATAASLAGVKNVPSMQLFQYPSHTTLWANW